MERMADVRHPVSGSVVLPVVGDVLGLSFEPLKGSGQYELDLRLDVEHFLESLVEFLGHLTQLDHVLREGLLVEFSLDDQTVHVVLVVEGEVVERAEERHLSKDSLDL